MPYNTRKRVNISAYIEETPTSVLLHLVPQGRPGLRDLQFTLEQPKPITQEIQSLNMARTLCHNYLEVSQYPEVAQAFTQYHEGKYGIDFWSRFYDEKTQDLDRAKLREEVDQWQSSQSQKSTSGRP
jgi:hypothetical protein